MRDSDPFTGGDGPSRAEVKRRIDSLYNRAETDSRTFNATRAMTLGTSSPGAPAVRPASGRGRGGSDPALDAVARQWFDMARGSLGPTVAAALPPDRLPDRSPAALPGRQDFSDTVRELEAAARPALELTAGPATALPALPPAERTAVMPELTAAPAELRPPAIEPAAPPAQLPPLPLPLAPGTVTVPGIPAQPAPVEAAAALPTAAQPAPARPFTAQPFTAQPFTDQPFPSQPLTDPLFTEQLFTAPPAAVPGPAPVASAAPWPAAVPASPPRSPSPAKPNRSSMGPAKDRNRLKLTAARQLLARHVARLAPPEPAQTPPASVDRAVRPTAPAAPPRGPEGQWPPQQPDGYGTAVYTAPAGVTAPGPATGPVPVVPAASAAPAAPEPPAPRPPVAPSPDSATPGKAAAALGFARGQIGRPCLSGAAGPEAYDCGGLTQAAWRAAGVALPRTAQEQAGTGTAIPLTELQPGDLLFFHGDSSHVGLVTGTGTMIHAPGPGASVREESVFFAGPQAIRGAVRPV
ncbi:NlpC/P60 family protein [Streptomyces sp. NPDC047000]|uniref:C40 family peptidase n=1 Tax=Streptomyces sp. NPDC047000 TaxID=3155474 RepID=UPI0033D1B721